MRCLQLSALMFGIKFFRYPAYIMSLCYMYLLTTFRILIIGYRPIYWILEFSYFLILVLALPLKVQYWSGPNDKKQNNHLFQLCFQFQPCNLPNPTDPVHSAVRWSFMAEVCNWGVQFQFDCVLDDVAFTEDVKRRSVTWLLVKRIFERHTWILILWYTRTLAAISLTAVRLPLILHWLILKDWLLTCL